MDFNYEVEKILKENGAAFVGFAPTPYEKLGVGISFGVKLSDFVLSQIEDAPTYQYFNHYRTANFLIDRLSFLIGNFIEESNYLYMPIAASQTVNGHSSYMGEYSHKKVAFMAGMGYIGKNSLFIHKKYGSKVRLGTVFTNMPLKTHNPLLEDMCSNCSICVKKCPAQAIYGEKFDIENPNKKLIDQKACSDFMKEKFMKIGRGSVCGICIKNCPYNRI